MSLARVPSYRDFAVMLCERFRADLAAGKPECVKAADEMRALPAEEVMAHIAWVAMAADQMCPELESPFAQLDGLVLVHTTTAAINLLKSVSRR